MAVFIVSLVVFLAMAGYSNAAYCVCKDGVSESALQKSIDYACGAGADCTPITQNGPCYNPNTVKDHCSWAVNSYYQKKGQVVGSCDFSGTAMVSPTAPTSSSGCSYPSSSSGGTVNTPSTTPTTPSTTNPGTGTGTGTGTGMGTGTGTGMGTPTTTIPGSSGSTPTFGLAPTGTGITNTDGLGSGSVALHQKYNLFITISLALVFIMCC